MDIRLYVVTTTSWLASLRNTDYFNNATNPNKFIAHITELFKGEQEQSQREREKRKERDRKRERARERVLTVVTVD